MTSSIFHRALEKNIVLWSSRRGICEESHLCAPLKRVNCFIVQFANIKCVAGSQRSRKGASCGWHKFFVIHGSVICVKRGWLTALALYASESPDERKISPFKSESKFVLIYIAIAVREKDLSFDLFYWLRFSLELEIALVHMDHREANPSPESSNAGTCVR